MRITRMLDGGDHATVYLNGEKLLYCVEADDETGEAICARLYIDGKPMATHVQPLRAGELDFDGVICEVRRGVVEIRFDEPHYEEAARRHFEDILAMVERYQAAKARRR